MSLAPDLPVDLVRQLLESQFYTLTFTGWNRWMLNAPRSHNRNHQRFCHRKNEWGCLGSEKTARIAESLVTFHRTLTPQCSMGLHGFVLYKQFWRPRSLRCQRNTAGWDKLRTGWPNNRTGTVGTVFQKARDEPEPKPESFFQNCFFQNYRNRNFHVPKPESRTVSFC